MNLPDTFEPPLSPAPFGAIDALRRPGEDAEPSGPHGGPAPLPNRLLRMGLVTLPQLTTALQRQAETGVPLPDVLVELGSVSAADMAALLADIDAAAAPVVEIAALPDPEPEPEPELALMPAPEPELELEPAPELALEPAPEPELALEPAPIALLPDPAPELAPAPTFVDEPAPAPIGRFAVVAQLEGGSRVELGVYADLPSASQVATEAMRAVREALSDWPLLGGRFVRPTSVVSIEVTALL